MEFYAPNGLKRPTRSSANTVKFAYDSLNHRYGIDTNKVKSVPLDHIKGFSELTNLDKYDTAVREIAERAPIRICENELISGAATLGDAIKHLVPASVNGTAVFQSVSHLTIDFEIVLKYGVNHIKAEALKAYDRYRNTERERFIKSCLNCLESFEIWHSRYISALSVLDGYEANMRNLSRVPFEAASDFYEAVQSLWFTFAFVRLCGNWPGIGRIDKLLGDYLKSDLDSGRLTLTEAREILAHFFIKGCEWVTGGDYGSGDAQHYQNIVLAGVDENGVEITNEVTYLVLDILEEFGNSDFPTPVRINSKPDDKLINRVSEVMRYGGGILAVYNEDLIIEALTHDGYPIEEARKFANDGCWEVQIPGKTYFSYVPFDSLEVLQKKTLNSCESCPDYPDFESLYSSYISDLRERVEAIFRSRMSFFADHDTDCRVWRSMNPCTVVSLFEQGCIEKGLSYLEGGPVYNITSPHIGGMADTVNSLFAIKKLVYDDKKLTLGELIVILKNNWEDNEQLRMYALNNYTYYGNNSDEADMLAVRLLNDFADICNSLDGRSALHFPAGVSTFGRQLEWSAHRMAVPYGRKAGEILAANCSPAPGSDREGATA
nr:pyruvate formate lyase family protein [Clostridia bacterium]